MRTTGDVQCIWRANHRDNNTPSEEHDQTDLRENMSSELQFHFPLLASMGETPAIYN